jgi:hypothetical protein
MGRPTEVLAARILHLDFATYDFLPCLKVGRGCEGSASHDGNDKASRENRELHIDSEGV